jgi:hypothetical protein
MSYKRLYTEQDVTDTVYSLERELRNAKAPDYGYRGFLRSELRRMKDDLPSGLSASLVLKVAELAK